MLVGQEIGLSEVLWISLFGMTVATVAIVLLMFFVILMSRVIQNRDAKALAPVSDAAVHSAAQTESAGVTEEEVAAIAATLCAETGLRPDQLRIVSITSK